MDAKAAMEIPADCLSPYIGTTFGSEDRKAQLDFDNRYRFHRWYARQGGNPGSMPWLAGAPPYGRHLPGVSMSIDVLPSPKWPIVIRNTRALHGAMTAVMGTGHGHRFNSFVLRQTDLAPSGWAIHWWDNECASFGSKTIGGMLYGKNVSFRFGAPFRIRAPEIKSRGRRTVRVDTITPLCFVSHSSVRRPTGQVLVDTLAGESLTRFGLQYVKQQNVARFEVESVVREQSASIDLGGKYGTVTGWEGSFVVETNAVGHWLLEAAARVGMGARTAFGFGQVRVSEQK